MAVSHRSGDDTKLHRILTGLSRGRVGDEEYAKLESRVCGRQVLPGGRIIGHQLTDECTSAQLSDSEKVAFIVPHRHEADMINEQFTPATDDARRQKGARVYQARTARPQSLTEHSQGV